MIDILPHIAGLLSELNAQIELAYRDTNVTFPLIVLTNITNSAQTTGCVEYWTRLTVQVDAYTLDKDDTYALAYNIDTILTANGFTRQNAFAITENALERYQMTFTCNIDFSHDRIIV